MLIWHPYSTKRVLKYTLVTFALSRLEVQKFLSARKIVQLKRVIVPLRGRCDVRLGEQIRVR